MKKNNNMTFKMFGKRYIVRKGGNLHLALEFSKPCLLLLTLVIWGFVFALLSV